VKVQGLGLGPRFLNVMTSGRREVEELTGQRMVPVLVTDAGEVIQDSARIAEWAERHPAGDVLHK
jgi:glutathione S-transferase